MELYGGIDLHSNNNVGSSAELVGKIWFWKIAK